MPGRMSAGTESARLRTSRHCDAGTRSPVPSAPLIVNRGNGESYSDS
jgi:hypothetical protein